MWVTPNDGLRVSHPFYIVTGNTKFQSGIVAAFLLLPCDKP